MPPAEAYDFDYCSTRVDPELLSASIAIRVFRIPLLAVPTGATRRGGWFGVDNLAIALAVRDVLAPFSGFPDVRITWHDAPRSAYAVEWGDRPPRGRTMTSALPSTAARGPTTPVPPLRLSPAVPPQLRRTAEKGPQPVLHVRKEDLHVSARTPLPHRARGRS
ncbi:DUF6302 family protein [Streptomyces sp. WG4]|uniref:DUF6302 family protein n=1 Tax=Streptomyces sp. WG4 TaxID=3417649 RepID=UPI003CE81B40